MTSACYAVKRLAGASDRPGCAVLLCPDTGTVLRGGGLGHLERSCRSAGRSHHAPGHRDYSLGFHLLREVP